MTTPVNFTPLDRLDPADIARSGAKAYNCARLKQAGFPVPDGLVVMSTATTEVLTAVGDHAWFDRWPADTLFAVRSSGIGEDGAGESFAGIHHTVLSVRRADVATAVAACRASGRSAHALEYRRAKGLDADTIAMGVLIQRMVRPIAAGVAFSVNPVTGSTGELVINASWGLGEALVSGQVDPDEFVIAKRDGKELWRRIGEKGAAAEAAIPSLTTDQTQELAAILIDIERHYGTPQDIEWCHDGERFWIVQSRPVTTGAARADEIEWTRANLAEVLPDVACPQVLSAFEDLLNQAERQWLAGLIAPESTLGPVVKAFCGRLHFNLSQLRHVCVLAGTAPAAMLRSMGHAEAIQPVDEQAPRLTLGHLKALPDLARIVWRHLRATQVIRRHHAVTRTYLAQFAATDAHRVSDADLWSVLDRWSAQAPDYMQTVLMLGNVMFHETPVRKACEKVGVPFEQLVYPQLAIGERSVSAQQAFDLVALAGAARREPAVSRYLQNGVGDAAQIRVALTGSAFLAELDRFLEHYGHRGLYEYDWSLPRYKEDPTPLLQALRAHLAGDGSSHADATDAEPERKAADAWAAFEQRLSRWQRWTMLRRVRQSIRRIKQYYVWREQVRSDLVRIIGAMRAWHLVLAERFTERKWLDRRDDYFLLHLPEVASIIERRSPPETLRAIVADRRVERARHAAIEMPLFMRESELPGLIRMARVSGGPTDGNDLRGQPVSSGYVEADVVVVRDPGDFGQMKRGAILVAPATDPSWTPLFTLASGVIVEVGGVLSHASTIAREYGLPALANVKHATKRLKTGDRVRLDAIQGVVHRVRSAGLPPSRSRFGEPAK